MARNSQSTVEGVLNRIVEDSSITGEFKSTSDIRIDGNLNGNLITTGKLVLGVSGRIEGDVTCENAEIEGTVSGKIVVRQLLSLKAASKVEGDIYTNKISIEPGAVFTGTCNMGKVKEMNQPTASEKTLQEQAV
ncbi:MAG TPA: cell shape determination protein CcmA [Flavobacteriales bacterium]|nr:cell shape determination protein CcmA [Flavobacteriales bacterium]|tara:strand:- start:12237 stop:12638 length:402 start_codon:yes stop_codon:yes gene_type:complete